MWVKFLLETLNRITQEEFDNNPLPSPSQLLEYPCFHKTNGTTTIWQVEL